MGGGGIARYLREFPTGNPAELRHHHPFRLWVAFLRALELASPGKEWDGEDPLGMATDDLLKTGQIGSVASRHTRFRMCPLASPVILLPSDPTRVAQLTQKLEEYRRRVQPHQAPDAQMDTLCETLVLDRLLQESRVITRDLSRELVTRFGTSFDPQAFRNACAVIND